MHENHGTPVWLLDIDGVINVDEPLWGGEPSEGRAFYGRRCMPIMWAPELVERIIAAHESDLVEIRWATTWVPCVGEIERLLGLPHLPTAWPADSVLDGFGVRMAKEDAARRVLRDERRPLIWTDDDAIPTPFGEPGDTPTLLIAPDTWYGLEEPHLDQIDAFLRECRAGAPVAVVAEDATC